MRRDKADLYSKASKNKLSAEFLQYFFTYNPNASVTQRKKAREALRKTRKVRTETA
jgi:hypothetical protein